MATNGGQIDLLFGVSKGSTTHVLAGLKKINQEANRTPQITEIKYKMSQDSKNKILGDFQKLASDINSSLDMLKPRSGGKSSYAQEYKSIDRLIEKTKSQIGTTEKLTQAQEKLNEVYNKMRNHKAGGTARAFDDAASAARKEIDEVTAGYNKLKGMVADYHKLEKTAATGSGKATATESTQKLAALRQEINQTAKNIGLSERDVEEALKRSAALSGQIAKAYDTRAQKAVNAAESSRKVESSLQSEQRNVEQLKTSYEAYANAKKSWEADPTNGEKLANLELCSKAYKDMVADMRLAADAEKKANSETAKRTQILANITSYTSKYDANLSKRVELQQRFNDLADRLRSGDITSNEAAKELAQLKAESKAAGVEIETLGQKLNRLLGAGVTQKIRTMLGTAVLTAGRKILSDVKEIDAAMTELYKVTDETETVYSRFLTNSGKRAKEFGSTMSDVIKATADFARLGYDLQDATDLSNAAIVFKNVGDGLDGIDDASEKIISIVKAFPEFEGNAMEIVDKMNEVGNNYAISSAGIGEALQRSVGALTAANNTLDESIALAVGMNAVTQDPAKVGTSLKTLTMYLRASKTEAEEAGEETDGMAESVSKLRGEILALTGQKVDIYDDNGDFKSTIQIMRELAAVWDQLSDVSQANLLERLGGKRNASIVASLLQNFGEVERALKTAENAEGSALRENEKYLDSIQGRLDVLKATGQSISSTLLQDRGLKNIMTIIQGIADHVDMLVGALGAIPTALGGFGVASIIKNLD